MSSVEKAAIPGSSSSKCDPQMAKYLVEQYGGADGELAAALRYLNQRYTIPDKVIGVLNDIGTEEFAHLEMIATMIYKLTKDATPDQLRAAGLGADFVSHGGDLFYTNAAGIPWNASYIAARAIPSRICTRTSRRRRRRGLPING